MKAVGLKSKRDERLELGTVIEERVVKTSGDTIVRKYTRGKLLGKGGFAMCYEVVNNDSKKVSAAKVVLKASLTKNRAKQKLMSEIKIHRSLQHANVVAFEHFFEDVDNVYILLEICTNQTLNELVRRRKKLTELEVQCYLRQLILGLKYLHAHRVIHRDLKLGNLFLTEKMELKIGDFGLATKLEFEGERKRTICGTPNYIAPEILEGGHGHSYEVDVWSLGVILYTMLIGKPPFETQDVSTTYKRIKMNIYSFPDTVPISDSAKNLIQRILSSDPSRRPKLDDIIAHPFLSTHKIPQLLPASTLACPPSASYARQFTGSEPLPIPPMKLESTVACKENLELKGASKERFTGLNTERAVLSRPDSKQGMKVPLSSARMAIPGTVGTGGYMKQATLEERPENFSKPAAGPTSSNAKVVATKPVAIVNDEDVVTPVQGPDVWIKKWVDYSSKYGLGYLLSNGTVGVLFNDSTKIVLDPNGHDFDYFEKQGPDRQDVLQSYTLTEYPKALQKKTTLLLHFRSHLQGEGGSAGKTAGSSQKKLQTAVYAKKWLRTRHAILFRLSNKIVQVNFQDGTEIILSSESKVVTYVNKSAERVTYPLNSALESTNAEMAKRLKYTKEILTRMLNQNQSAHNKEPNKHKDHANNENHNPHKQPTEEHPHPSRVPSC